MTVFAFKNTVTQLLVKRNHFVSVKDCMGKLSEEITTFRQLICFTETWKTVTFKAIKLKSPLKVLYFFLLWNYWNSAKIVVFKLVNTANGLKAIYFLLSFKGYLCDCGGGCTAAIRLRMSCYKLIMITINCLLFVGVGSWNSLLACLTVSDCKAYSVLRFLCVQSWSLQMVFF